MHSLKVDERALVGRPRLHPATRLLLNLAGVPATSIIRPLLDLSDCTGPLADDEVVLRFALELEWLRGLCELSLVSATLLAARTAGCFAIVPGVAASTSPLISIFATLTGSTPVEEMLVGASNALASIFGRRGGLACDDIERVKALWPIAVPTECLLASGGDDRLSLDPATGLNRYGCAPWPRAEVVSFGSCTASSLSENAFVAAELARRKLAAATLETAPSVALANASDDIGEVLLNHFDVADLAAAVLAASGTDATLVVTGLLAAERSGEMLTSILMSPSETGSGVPDAVRGRHFASSAAAGCKVGKGEPIEGLGLGPSLITVPLRDTSGKPYSPSAIAAECVAAIDAGAQRGHVVLHAIDGSKTGLTAPDRETCSRLARRFGNRLDIVVDACQARIEPALVRWYLQQGFPVLVTGSKFFSAPGFCGAVLFPRARLAQIARHGRLPAGLAPYARLEGGFGSRRCPGLILRWHAALHQMKRFGQLTPAEVKERLEQIGASVTTCLEADSRLELVEAPRPPGFGWSDVRSVFTFSVHSSTGPLCPANLRLIYEALNDSEAVEGGSAMQRSASIPCQIGQPVELGSQRRGGLRIAVSAEQVTEDRSQESGLRIVMDKLGQLLDAGCGQRFPDAEGTRAIAGGAAPLRAALMG